MKHKKNEPEHPLHFSKYNSPPRTRKRGTALLHVPPSLFFQLEQQPFKPTLLSQGQALLALFLFLRWIKPVSSSGLIPCCPLYLECSSFHVALLVHLHPSDFTLNIPSPETPGLALVSESTLSSLIWPNELTKFFFKKCCFEILSSLILGNSNEPFLDQIVICNEKWILYNNLERPAQWLDWKEAPKHFPKPNLH